MMRAMTLILRLAALLIVLQYAKNEFPLLSNRRCVTLTTSRLRIRSMSCSRLLGLHLAWNRPPFESATPYRAQACFRCSSNRRACRPCHVRTFKYYCNEQTVCLKRSLRRGIHLDALHRVENKELAGGVWKQNIGTPFDQERIRFFRASE